LNSAASLRACDTNDFASAAWIAHKQQICNCIKSCFKIVPQFQAAGTSSKFANNKFHSPVMPVARRPMYFVIAKRWLTLD